MINGITMNLVLDRALWVDQGDLYFKRATWIYARSSRKRNIISAVTGSNPILSYFFFFGPF